LSQHSFVITLKKNIEMSYPKLYQSWRVITKKYVAFLSKK